jgi:DNA-directed RNA polymerase specialized sigma24 family protein
MLEILSRHHDMLLRYVLSFGVNPDTAKDIVQEFYLKMHDNKKSIVIGEEINFYFAYLVIRNMVFDLKKKEKKINYLEIPSERPDIWFNNYVAAKWCEQPLNHIDYDKSKSAYVTKWLNEHDFSNLDLNNIQSLEKIYHACIFNEIIIEKKSISQLSRELNVTYHSIRNTVKIIKNEIKHNYEAWNKTREDI